MKTFRKTAALLLCLVMVLSLIPTGAFAWEEERAEPMNPEANYGLINQYHVGTQAVTDAYLRGESLEINGVTVGQPVRDLPSSWDSRTQGWITSVKNQNPYGSCWAHAALGSVEAYMIKNGVPVGTGAAATTSLNLSETQHCFFNYSSAYDAENMTTGDKTTLLGSDSCLDTGGNGEMSAYTLQHWTGAADESVSALAYSKASTVASSGLGSQYAYGSNVAHVQNSLWIPATNIDAVKQAIMDYGAGNISYYETGNAYTYICTIDTSSQESSSHKWSNHAITLVGWDDTIAASRFSPNKPSKPGAWLCKNSWGTSQFNAGYCWISYEDTSVLEGYIYFYDAESIDNYDHNYQYDGTCNPVCYGKGWPSNADYYVGFANDTQVANVFTAKGSEVLKAVALCNWDEALSYTVEIYKNPSTGNPSSGTLMTTQTGTLTYSGYYTIKLDNPVALNTGDTFSVVITQHVPEADEGGAYVHTPYDASFKNTDVVSWASWTHVDHGNTSYYKEPNGSWTDCPDKGDYRIKAYTDDYVEDPVPVSMELIALGQVVNTLEGTAGQTVVTLPETAPEAEGWSFVGWMSAELDSATEKPNFFAPGASFKLTASVPALYALYSKQESGGVPAYVKVNDDAELTDGQYLIVNEEAGRAMDGSKSSYNSGTNYVNISITDNSVPATTATDGYSFTWNSANGTLKNAAGYYIYRSSGSSGGSISVTTSESTAAGYPNEVSVNGGDATIHITASSWLSTYNYYLTYNTTGYFRYYTNQNQQPIQLYKRCEGSYTYSTNPIQETPCAHDGTKTETRVEPTCTQDGLLTVTCDLCGEVLSVTELPALGHTAEETWSFDNTKHWHVCSVCGEPMGDAEAHTWDEGVITTAPTPADPGELTYTCEICQHTKTESIPALGYDYTVHFSVPEGQEQPEDMVSNTNTGIMLPILTAPEGFGFVGWVLEDYEKLTELPEGILTGSYTAQEEVTLKALYAHGQYTAPTLTQMNLTDTLEPGDKLVIVESNEVYGLYQKTVNNSYVQNYEFTPDPVLLASDEKNWLTVAEAPDGGWYLGDEENGWLYTSGSNNLAINTNQKTAWTLTERDGELALMGNNRYLSCRTDLTGDNQNLWRMGGTNGTSGITTLHLYKLKLAETSYDYYTTTLAPAVQEFGDVKDESAWYYDPVYWAVENGITNGVGNGLFAPDQACTRAQVVTFLWRAAGSPVVTETEIGFEDVSEGAWYHDAVLWAVENGITTGTSASSFSPNQPCTRAQAVTFLWRAAKLRTDYQEPSSTELPFTDVPASAWYREAVLWALENGVTAGTSATRFSPNTIVSRAQMVTFLWRYMK